MVGHDVECGVATGKLSPDGTLGGFDNGCPKPLFDFELFIIELEFDPHALFGTNDDFSAVSFDSAVPMFQVEEDIFAIEVLGRDEAELSVGLHLHDLAQPFSLDPIPFFDSRFLITVLFRRRSA